MAGEGTVSSDRLNQDGKPHCQRGSELPPNCQPATDEHLAEKTTRLLQLSSDLLKSAAKTNGQRVPSLEDVDDVEIGWRGLVGVMDHLLEKADTALDEYTGLVKRKNAPTPELAGTSAPPQPRPDAPQGSTLRSSKHTDRLERSLLRANIMKPQTSFERRPDNFAMGPWRPFLSQKPHAIVPLEESLSTFVENQNTSYDCLTYLPLLAPSEKQVEDASLTPSQKSCAEKKRWKIRNLGSCQGANGSFRYKHPYETEILSMKYPDAVYTKRDPILYLPADTTEATWVDTFEGVLAMLEELKQVDEIAIDLEHHDYRSYTGILSLMQISTREKDWVVDTLKPWRHQLEILNEVFADPTKVKVGCRLGVAAPVPSPLTGIRFSMGPSWILSGCSAI